MGFTWYESGVVKYTPHTTDMYWIAEVRLIKMTVQSKSLTKYYLNIILN